MIRSLLSVEGLDIVAGISLNRWLVGFSYETLDPTKRAFLFRFGPLWIQFLSACEQ